MTEAGGETVGAGPLQGIRVIELEGIGPAPFAGLVLADLGADVIGVTRPQRPEMSPIAPEHDLVNRGKRFVCIDLKEQRGVEQLLSLVERADMLTEGMRPGVAERLGVGPETCLERNPRLIFGRATGWGQDGPWASRAGHDISYLAVTGALHSIGRADGPPQVPLNLLGDLAGCSLYLVIGMLSALAHSRATGRGQTVDAAVVDGAAHLMTGVFSMLAADLWRDERGVNLIDTGRPYYDVFETSDGGFIAAGPLEAKFYAEFVEVLGFEVDGLPPRDEPGSFAELRGLLADRFKTATRDEWSLRFESSDACVAPVLSLSEAGQNEHLRERGTYVEVDGIVQPAPAPRFSATAPSVNRPPSSRLEPEEILADWTGKDEADRPS
jgi:alpha-methylacyl-CoA racemase